MRVVKIGLISSVIIVGIVSSIAYFFKIETDHYCCESPTYRWKFAIYCGECDDETGCHFKKIEKTGLAEYFGLSEIPCEQNQ